MNKQDLIAPAHYNLVTEFEKYAVDEEKLALIWESENGQQKKSTYKNLIQKANKIANLFTRKGLQKGDVVLIMVPRLIEAYEIYIAALKAGLVVIPSSEMLRAKDIEYRLTHSEAKAIIAYEPFLDQFKEVRNLDKRLLFAIGNKKDKWISLTEEI